MPSLSLEKALSTLAKVNTDTLTGTNDLAMESSQDEMSIVYLAENEDWTKLSQQGSRQIDKARRYLDGILKRRRQVSDNEKLAHATDRKLARIESDFIAMLDDPDFVQDMSAILADEGLSADEIKKWFNTARKPDASNDIPTMTERLKEVADDLENRAAWLSLLALLGVECRWLARFNKLAHGRGPRTPVSEQLAHLEGILDGQQTIIEGVDRKAYGLLQANDWEGLAVHAESGIDEALTARSSAGVVLVDAAVALQKLRSRPLTNPVERARANTLACRCGGLLRRQLLSYAIAFRLAFIAAVGGETSRGRAERKRAKEDPFDSLSPQGTSVTLAKLMADPARYHDRMVAVDGEVHNLVTQVKRGKATSRFQLVDPSSGTEISVFVPYIQIDSTGLVDGCAAHLVGPWLKYDRESRQECTLHIDRIAFKQQAKKSWLDYQTAGVRAFFDYLPHNLNMAWSWQAGNPGAVNHIRYTTVWEQS